MASLANSWNGQIIKLSSTDFGKIPWARVSRTLPITAATDIWFEAPFSYGNSLTGVNFRDKIVVYKGDAPWPNILHEMGHVFATTANPALCAEDDFFGWEYQIGKNIDLDEWLKYNKDYRIGTSDGDTVDLGKLPRKVAIKELERYMRNAKACGLVTRRGTLKTLRESCSRC